jgi:hypothetical protein
MIGFKVFGVADDSPEDTAEKMEAAISKWIASLPPGTEIRRTQLAAGQSGSVTMAPPLWYSDEATNKLCSLYAMINYKLREVAKP